MVKRGLPTDVKMRHDSHYVEELTKTHRSVGRIIPITQIEPNPEQPRTDVGDLTELSDSIKQKGVLEPILVKPSSKGRWMIIAGERRWRAANLAGLAEVPCIELDLDEKSIAEIALIENLQRKDLTIWEEADGLAFLAERFDYTHEEIAKKIGKSRSTVTELMSIAGLPESIRLKCRKNNVSAKSALLEIARQFDEESMHEYLDSGSTKNAALKDAREKNNSKNSKGKFAEQKSDSQAKKTFVFSSAENNFVLEIRFEQSAEFERRDVLRALKIAFDKVKAEDSSK